MGLSLLGFDGMFVEAIPDFFLVDPVEDDCGEWRGEDEWKCQARTTDDVPTIPKIKHASRTRVEEDEENNCWRAADQILHPDFVFGWCDVLIWKVVLV